MDLDNFVKSENVRINREKSKEMDSDKKIVSQNLKITAIEDVNHLNRKRVIEAQNRETWSAQMEMQKRRGKLINQI